MVSEDRDSVIASHELALELTRDPELAAEVASSLDKHRESTAALVGRGIGGNSVDADAAIISAVMDSLTLGWIARPEDEEYARRVHRIVRRLVEKLF